LKTECLSDILVVLALMSTTNMVFALLAAGGAYMKEILTIVTRKGQITLPAEIRRSLDIKEGDKVAVSLAQTGEGEQPQVLLRPVRSVAEMTFGAAGPRKEPVDLDSMRRTFEEETAKKVMDELEARASQE
jgi:AbrB family looped-hinge helix DNA binding protein